MCHHCKKPFSERDFPTVGFRETCPYCSADLHICLNCSLYDEGAYHECKESQAEWVKDKEKWNRCEYFRASGSVKPQGDKSKMLSDLDALFKK